MAIYDTSIRLKLVSTYTHMWFTKFQLIWWLQNENINKFLSFIYKTINTIAMGKCFNNGLYGVLLFQRANRWRGVWASVFWMQYLHCLQNLFSIYLYVKVFHVKLTISFQVSWTDSKLNCSRGNYKHPRQGDIRRRNARIVRSLCIKKNSTTFKSRSG